MAVAVSMLHTISPKQVVWDALPKDIGDVQILANDVLVGMYVRPSQTASGIHLPDKGIRSEDSIVGKAGMIIRMGPLAFVRDEGHDWGDVIPQVGDWVAIWVMDAARTLELGGQRCRVVEDVHVKMILPRPDMIL